MIKIKRGDIVLVAFPFSDINSIKKRPALVVQADNLNTGLDKLIVAQISSQLRRANHPSRVLILMSDPLSSQTGLRQDSVILTDILATVDLALLDRKIGDMPNMNLVDIALRKSLAL